MKKILVLSLIVGLLAYRIDATESDNVVAELDGALGEVDDQEFDEAIVSIEGEDEDLLLTEDEADALLALVEDQIEGMDFNVEEESADEDKLQARPCRSFDCRAYRCKKNCKALKHCRCECKRLYGVKAPNRFKDVHNCPGDSKPSSGGSGGSGGAGKPGVPPKSCKTNGCKRARCRSKCKGRSRRTCLGKCNRKYRGPGKRGCKTQQCKFNTCVKKCGGGGRCRSSCRTRYLIRKG